MFLLRPLDGVGATEFMRRIEAPEKFLLRPLDDVGTTGLLRQMEHGRPANQRKARGHVPPERIGHFLVSVSLSSTVEITAVDFFISTVDDNVDY